MLPLEKPASRKDFATDPFSKELDKFSGDHRVPQEAKGPIMKTPVLLAIACITLLAVSAVADTAGASPAVTNNGPAYTTNFGVPIFNNNESLTVGFRGDSPTVEL